MATIVNRDLRKIGYIVDKSLTGRIGNPAIKKDSKYKLRYEGYNLKVWSIAEVTLLSFKSNLKIQKKLSL